MGIVNIIAIAMRPRIAVTLEQRFELLFQTYLRLLGSLFLFTTIVTPLFAFSILCRHLALRTKRRRTSCHAELRSQFGKS